MMLVEIVEGPQTSPAVMQIGQAFTRQIDKLPLPCKSAPGFLVNRVLSPYLLEAMLMVDEGIPPETIDAAAKDFGMPMGPIELADMVGLDIGWAVGQELAKPGSPIPKKLQSLVEAKKFGKKSGQGFYTWTNGKAQKSSIGPGTVDLKALADRMVLAGAERGGGVRAREDRRRCRSLRRGRDLRHRLRAASRRPHRHHPRARQAGVAPHHGRAQAAHGLQVRSRYGLGHDLTLGRRQCVI